MWNTHISEKSRQKYCMYNLIELYKNMYLNGKNLEDNIKKHTLHKERFLKYCFSSSKPGLWCYTIVFISSVQSLSHVRLFATPWTAARQASLSITNSWSLLKLVSVESVMSSNHLIPSPPPFRRHLNGSKWGGKNWKIM